MMEEAQRYDGSFDRTASFGTYSLPLLSRSEQKSTDESDFVENPMERLITFERSFSLELCD
jgi:hypothetical protein